jgi:hypothetical protein
LSALLAALKEFFNCAKRGDRWFLAAEPSVECYDFSTQNKHRQLLPFCITALVVYVLGIPALFATLLFRRARILRHRQGLQRIFHEREVQNSKTRVREKSRFRTAGQTHEAAKAEILRLMDVDELHVKLDRAIDLYGFLFRHYREQEYWWELLVLSRKLAFAVIVNMPKMPEAQTMLGIIVLFAYIAIAQALTPYMERYLTLMDLVGASMATAIAMAGLVMFGGFDTRLATDPVSTRRQRSYLILYRSLFPVEYDASLSAS